MSQVKTISGRAIPLVGNDIDTDRIIPARFLRSITFDGLGESVFIDDRTQSQGQHPFNQPQYQGANILIVNGNFGCGSSREHAPQAIAKWGIQALIGESFAEIFLGNCVAIGIACVTADSATVKHLQAAVAADSQTQMQIDLENQQIQLGDFSASLSINEGARQMLTTGTWDACGQLVAQAEAIRVTATHLPYLQWSVSA